MQRLRATIAGVLLAAASATAQPTDELPRRAHLGVSIAPPTRSAPARVTRVTRASVLERAGVRAGDTVTTLQGEPIRDGVHLDTTLAALRAGQTLRLGIERGGEPQVISVTLPALPREVLPGVEIQYTHVSNPSGLRQRVIVTRPAGARAPLPAVLFVPWLSCDSVESPLGPAPGIDALLAQMARDSGWVLVRVEKPGVGDSEGVCSETDLDTEIAGSRAALLSMRRHSWIDPARLVVMGQSFSGAFLPIVARDVPVAGFIVANGWVRTWMERLIEFERRQAEASGMAPDRVSARQRKLGRFYTEFLEHERTPAEVLARFPDLAEVWQDGPAHQYGRSARFHHQLQRLNAAEGWSRVAVPSLVLFGEADVVMHRTDHERIVALVNRQRPGAASLVTIPGADHALAVTDAEGRRTLPPAVFDAVRRFLDGLAPPAARG